MPEIRYSRRFWSSLRILDRHRKVDEEDFEHFLYLLAKSDELPPEYDEHPLTDNWEGYRDAHLAADVVVIFKRRENVVWLELIGTHAQLFGARKNRATRSSKPPAATFEEAVEDVLAEAARSLKRWWRGKR